MVKQLFKFENAAHVLIVCFGFTSFSNIKTFLTHAGHDGYAAAALSMALGAALIVCSIALTKLDWQREKFTTFLLISAATALGAISGGIQSVEYTKELDGVWPYVLGYGIPLIGEVFFSLAMAQFEQSRERAQTAPSAVGPAAGPSAVGPAAGPTAVVPVPVLDAAAVQTNGAPVQTNVQAGAQIVQTNRTCPDKTGNVQTIVQTNGELSKLGEDCPDKTANCPDNSDKPDKRLDKTPPVQTNSKMSKQERQNAVRELRRAQPDMSVEALAQHFGVAVKTIERDLSGQV